MGLRKGVPARVFEAMVKQRLIALRSTAAPNVRGAKSMFIIFAMVRTASAIARPGPGWGRRYPSPATGKIRSAALHRWLKDLGGR